MKLYKYILFLVFLCGVTACTDLDIAPINVVTDEEIFSSESGINSYRARLYSQMPIEDFKYSFERGFNHFWLVDPLPANTGESLHHDTNGVREDKESYWEPGYKLLRDIHYFLETLPEWKDRANYTDTQINTWTGEAYCIRAITYMALVKRFGGVPLVLEMLNYPETPIEELQLPRASEAAVYDQISEDLDKAFELLPESSHSSILNKYVAAGFKSRAMLYAGSIAKYNDIEWLDPNNGNTRVCGIPADKAAGYFKQAYEAAKLLEGRYSLYLKDWKAGDKEAQYNNFVNLFFADDSPENVFIREYSYPDIVHGYDAYAIARQFMVAGYTSFFNPTLDFVEMFDGFPKTAEGYIDVYDGSGYYKMFDNQMQLFADAEPRLRATVIFPGDEFKGEEVEIWRGIYKGNVGSGITRLLPADNKQFYEETSVADLLYTSAGPDDQQTVVTLPDGTQMNAAGRSGSFYDNRAPALSGFTIRKLLNPDMPAGQVLENRSDQNWIELRYAEVLLNRAEAAYELYLLGETGADYVTDAYNCIEQIRERAGADLLGSAGALNDIEIIRKERRKELGFENKTWGDLRRWRVQHEEQRNRTYRVLRSFYVMENGKWFFDERLDERGTVYDYNTNMYYRKIESGDLNKNPKLIQNPGY
ncbi:MAG: RagB/SusD family nutrient uptake outer membrane protein [Tannerellaceae bacterium]|nr:RagB/SusD family nutrient uptake outer membrane protein [Tannerellaceae bacterium]